MWQLDLNNLPHHQGMVGEQKKGLVFDAGQIRTFSD